MSLLGIESDVAAREARLIFPQTPYDDVGLILRTPRRDRQKAAAEEHAAALRSLSFDPFPVLVEFLTDYDLGSDAAYAMLAADPQRALSLLFASMPKTGANIERIGFMWFVAHAGDAALTAQSRSEAHAAALRVLALPSSGSEGVELALHTIGLSGGPEDLPLLNSTINTAAAGPDAGGFKTRAKLPWSAWDRASTWKKSAPNSPRPFRRSRHPSKQC